MFGFGIQLNKLKQFKGLLNRYVGATAAYSLRKLSSTYSGPVVKVRRGSDDAEADFTYLDVSDSTLQDWVNGHVVTYTSDFSAGVDGWSADSASSVTTTPDPVGTLDVLKYTVDTETTAKFLSRNALNIGQQYTVQAQVYVPSSNVDLDSIVLMDGSGNMATSYLGIQRDEWVTVSTVGTARLGNINIRGASGTTASAYNGFQGNGTDVFYARNVVITQTSIDKLDLQTETGGLIGNVTNETATGFDFSVNNEGSNGFKGLLSLANTTTGTYTATFDVVLNSGSLSEVIIRSGNPPEEAVLVAGANSFTCTPTGIAGIYFRTDATAVADVSITNITLAQTTADGHVTTWYDQSGNTNHATQATPASQPKVVDAGVLVAGGIDFDGVDDHFELDLGANLAQPNSFFMVHESDTLGFDTNEFFDAVGTASPRTLIDSTGGAYRLAAPTDFTSTLTIDLAQKTVVGAFANSTSSFLSKNGEISATSDAGTDGVDQFSYIGRSFTRYYDGKMDEFIIYNSDQSASRVAIEGNIASHYDITI